MPETKKDTVKIGKNFYILQTQKQEKETLFKIEKQVLSKTETLKEIVVPNSSSNIEKIHEVLLKYFFYGLKKTEDPYKASEYVEQSLKNEYKEIKSKDVEFDHFTHPCLEKLCSQKCDYCDHLLGFIVFKGKSYFKCLPNEKIEEDFEKIIFALHNFLESSKKAIKNMIGELKSASFNIDDKLVIYFKEKEFVFIFICEYHKLGLQLKAAEKIKEDILKALK